MNRREALESALFYAASTAVFAGFLYGVKDHRDRLDSAEEQVNEQREEQRRQLARAIAAEESR